MERAATGIEVRELADKEAFAYFVGDGATVVLFYAPWCVHCPMQQAILAHCASGFGARLRLGRLDVDNCSECADAHEVAYLPTLVAFTDGREMGRLAGLQSEAAVAGMLAMLVSRRGEEAVVPPRGRGLIESGAEGTMEDARAGAEPRGLSPFGAGAGAPEGISERSNAVWVSA